MTRLAMAAAAFLSTFSLAACGGTSTSAAPPNSMPMTSAPAASAPAEDHNDADVTFAQMMIPHHEQAIEMAKLAPTRAQSADVKDLAAQIQSAQDPEIAQLKAWLTSWDEPTTADQAGGMTGMNGMNGMDHSQMSGGGMMSSEDMSKLEGLSGAEFDHAFLTMMTAHHQGAIDMARTEQSDGSYGPAKDMAANIVRTQSDEIDTMNKLLKAMK